MASKKQQNQHYKIEVQLRIQRISGLSAWADSLAGSSLFVRWKCPPKRHGSTKKLKADSGRSGVFVWDEPFVFTLKLDQEAPGIFRKSYLSFVLTDEQVDAKKLKVRKLGKAQVNLSAFIRADSTAASNVTVPLNMEKLKLSSSAGLAATAAPSISVSFLFRFLRLGKWNLVEPQPQPNTSRVVQISGKTFQLESSDEISHSSDSDSSSSSHDKPTTNNAASIPRSNSTASVSMLDAEQSQRQLHLLEQQLLESHNVITRQQQELAQLTKQIDELERIAAGSAPQQLVLEHLLRENTHLKHSLELLRAGSTSPAAASASTSLVAEGARTTSESNSGAALADLQAQIQAMSELSALLSHVSELQQQQQQRQPQQQPQLVEAPKRNDFRLWWRHAVLLLALEMICILLLR